MLYICYVALNNKEAVPVICKELKQSELFKNHIVLIGTQSIEDGVLPLLDITEISVSKSSVKYIVHGNIKHTDPEIQKALEFSAKRKKELEELKK